MRKLYEIKDDIANMIELDAERFVNGETGEIISREAFDALNEEYDDKIEGVALGAKREKAMVEAIENEIRELKQRKEYHEKRYEGYKRFLAMELADRKRFETAKVKIGWRESESVEVTCPVLTLPEEYLRYAPPEPNKTLLKADIKAGKVIPGAEIVKKKSIQIR